MSESTEPVSLPNVDPSGLTALAEGVWLIPDRRIPLVPNVGIVEGENAVLVIDTGMGPTNGELVLGAAQRIAAGRPLTLTLTHFHPEHAFGAQAFRGNAQILVNARQAHESREKGIPYLEMFRTFGPAVVAALEGVELVEPDVTYSGTTTIDLGGRTVSLRETGLTHTSGDQLITVDDVNITFAGDLVEERCFPIIPYFPPDDVDLDGAAWIDLLAALEAEPDATIVPGHGAVGGIEIVRQQREFMEMMRDATFASAAAGHDADETIAELEAKIVAQHPDWSQPEWVGFGIRYFHATHEAAQRAAG